MIRPLDYYIHPDTVQRLDNCGHGNEHAAAENLFACDRTREKLRETLDTERKKTGGYEVEAIYDIVWQLIAEAAEDIFREYRLTMGGYEFISSWIESVFFVELDDLDQWEVALALVEALDASEKDE